MNGEASGGQEERAERILKGIQREKGTSRNVGSRLGVRCMSKERDDRWVNEGLAGGEDPSAPVAVVLVLGGACSPGSGRNFFQRI
jgi:hypothetical protein